MPKASKISQRLVKQVSAATSGAPNETSLRHELEGRLKEACKELHIPWTPFRLDLLLEGDDPRRKRFADVAHGAVVIEYEAPRSFGGREAAAQLRHAREQAQEYAELLAAEEGRSLGDYVMVAWDGAHISFGTFQDLEPHWTSLTLFDSRSADRLLDHLARDGRPVVHPRLISSLVGPESDLGGALIPLLFEALQETKSKTNDPPTKSHLLFVEWRRLFGQVTGVQSSRLRELLAEQGATHGQPYGDAPATYLFALNTYIALVAKLVAALALRGASEDIRDASVAIKERISALESGQLFLNAGVLNMLSSDFFSWYADDPAWKSYAAVIDKIVVRLSGVDFDVRKKSADATRDLFKELYQSFVPRALRHAFGEYYTPDWLAAHALDQIGWEVEDGLIDPTCGSGTFLLEAVRRRLREAGFQDGAEQVLKGIFGLDLNPLAVLTARASLIVFLSNRLDPTHPIRLPVYLADAINPATAQGSTYHHTIQTELKSVSFAVPSSVVQHTEFFEIFGRMRELIDDGRGADDIAKMLTASFSSLAALGDEEARALDETIATLVEMHERGWDGIWCAILAERFAAGSIPPSTHVCGNPPWVKWSNLPPEYAAFIKDRCLELGVFSKDRWVGGIESDISTVITYEALEKWLAKKGDLAFFITGTVFANESSQGFRRFHLENSGVMAKVIRVEDFEAVAPFEGVRNHPTLLWLRRDQEASYPVPYWIWNLADKSNGRGRMYSDATEFLHSARLAKLWAMPVPGSDQGPWLKGTKEQLAIWSHIFGDESGHSYRARKGVTPDRNGIFFVRVHSLDEGGKVALIENDPGLGRTRGIAKRKGRVEAEHLFPLLRGRGVEAFSAKPDPVYRILLPQRGMHGDSDLPRTAPQTFRYLSRFRKELEARSSYRRYQAREPYWSIWSTGPYTFAPFKVVWREMAGGRFAASLVSSHQDPILGKRVVVPDHKLYFVPLDCEEEGAFLAGILNAPVVAEAISAYAAQLSLGTSVVEYLDLPRFDKANKTHREITRTSLEAAERGGATGEELVKLDRLARYIFIR